MFKFNCFLITVTISFLSLFLFQTETSIQFSSTKQAHDIKFDVNYNTSGISANNSFHELFSFDKLKLTSVPFTNSFKYIKKGLSDYHANYFKTCNLIDLNLTVRTIIYPFHSFL